MSSSVIRSTKTVAMLVAPLVLAAGCAALGIGDQQL
jgi:hypothetical protein